MDISKLLGTSMIICTALVSAHVSKLSLLIHVKTMLNRGEISAISHAIFVHRILKSGLGSPSTPCLRLPFL